MRYTIEIECGEKTCASEPGKFCRGVLVTHFGSRYCCDFYRGSDGYEEPLRDGEDGWLMRCKQCLEKSRKE